jgi:hypothetical protein
VRRCPSCAVRFGPLRLLFQTKYYEFACFSCGATLERDFAGAAAGWILAIGFVVGAAGLVVDLCRLFARGDFPELVALGPMVAVALARLFLPVQVTEPPV